MATAEVASRPQSRRRPFANLVKRLANFKGGEDKDKEKKEKEDKASNKKSNGAVKGKKNSAGKNNPYPQSGHLRQEPQSSYPSTRAHDNTSYSSLADRNSTDREGPSQSNKSGAPTLATNAETVHSDAGHSKAATTTTAAGALSSMDGAGAGSTFSSPNHSQRSLATTLTTIQSTNMSNPTNGPSSHTLQSQPMGSAFSHQYPVTPGQLGTGTASAIPRHLHGDANAANSPATYNSATTGNLLTDNASILTLASSSKRRRRSMDTDASVRAMAPSSVFGGSRESLPLSVLSGNANTERYSTSGMHTASAERTSIYSSSGMMRERDAGGVSSPALASERNSYYANKQPGDAKSLRSITNLQRADDARSIGGIDSRSINDARSTHDVASLRSVDARSQLASADHGRNGSIHGSIGSPAVSRQGTVGGGSGGEAETKVVGGSE